MIVNLFSMIAQLCRSFDHLKFQIFNVRRMSVTEPEKQDQEDGSEDEKDEGRGS